MYQGHDAALLRQLDLLEDKGRGRWLAAARRDVAAGAATWAARSAPVVPLGALVLALAGRAVGVFALIALSLLVPLLAFVGGSATRLRRLRIDRTAALALLDRRLALKDRIVTADEFLHGGACDGFRAAAVQEAAPRLAEALATALPVLAARARAERRWPFVLAAIVLALAAMLVGVARPSRESAASDARRATVAARIARMIGIGERASATAERSVSGAGLGLAGSAAGAGGAAQAGLDGAAPGRPGDGESGRTDAGGVAPAGTAGARAAGAAAAGGGAAGEARRSSDRAGKAGSADSATAGSGAAAARGDEAGAQATPAAPAGKAARGNGATPAGTPATPPAGTPPPPGMQAGAGTPPGGADRPREGQQSGQSGQSGQGASNRTGQQGGGRGSGQDGPKRSRGTSMLLLAVPIEDRVSGTVNAGRVTTVTRPSRPQAMPAAAVTAQDRGVQGGDAGRIVHRAPTVQEQRVLRRVFRRPGMEP